LARHELQTGEKDTGKVYDMLVLELLGHGALTWLYFYIWLCLVAKVSHHFAIFEGNPGEKETKSNETSFWPSGLD
jgi:hypothetical protein